MNKKKNLSIMDYLVGQNIEEIVDRALNLQPNDLIRMGILYRDIELLKMGVEQGGAVYSWHLMNAISYGEVGMVKQLLTDKKARTHIAGYAALSTAIEEGHFDVAKELLKHKEVKPNAKSSRIIAKAVRSGQIETVKFLINHERVEPRSKSRSLINSALERHYYRVSKRYSGYTSFLYPDGRSEHLEIAEILIKSEKIRNSLSKSSIKDFEERCEKYNNLFKDMPITL